MSGVGKEQYSVCVLKSNELQKAPGCGHLLNVGAQSMCNIPMVNLDALQAANYAELPPDSLRISSSSWFCLPLGQAKKLLLQKANCFIPV